MTVKIAFEADFPGGVIKIKTVEDDFGIYLLVMLDSDYKAVIYDTIKISMDDYIKLLQKIFEMYTLYDYWQRELYVKYQPMFHVEQKRGV